jgi:hypothetical protein
VGLVYLNGPGWWSADPVCLWIAGLAGFRDTVHAEIMQACACLRMWPSKDCVGLCWHEGMAGQRSQLGRSWGHGPVKWISCRPVQAWGMQPSRTEILCVWISGVACLGGITPHTRDLAGLCSPGGLADTAEFMCLCILSLAGLRGAGLQSGY